MSATNSTYTGSPYDVFVSYSHGDPRGTGRAPLADWTHRLIDELRQDIESTSTEFDQLALWDDREADPTLNLTPMIKDCVSNSALLLIVMSPRYLASCWCKDELEWFGEELRQRCKGEGHTLVVRALPTQEEKWPSPLKDTNGHSLLGFWFHPRPAKEGVKPFGWPDPRPSDREFFDALSQPLHDRDAALAEIEGESGPADQCCQDLHAAERQADGLLAGSSSRRCRLATRRATS